MKIYWVEFAGFILSYVLFGYIFSTRLKLLFTIFRIYFLGLLALFLIYYIKFVIDTETFQIETGALIYGSILVIVGLMGWLKFDPSDEGPTQHYYHKIVFLYVYCFSIFIPFIIIQRLGMNTP
ncbi:hypothetical protein FZC78_16140 [Rossellomorea vietnamensis]|uniref:Uncharacterized protein n=1 Tax=Rossellomorea vietnamensis TaxID=218284 RepID=A0A5D4NNG8_9BACI|nr:hypothetical protein [Rossellomorea vietnamensis]TYS15184.1 hypothetical protein FZC78_16140 [Rossellomorea vietnamensis]